MFASEERTLKRLCIDTSSILKLDSKNTHSLLRSTPISLFLTTEVVILHHSKKKCWLDLDHLTMLRWKLSSIRLLQKEENSRRKIIEIINWATKKRQLKTEQI